LAVAILGAVSIGGVWGLLPAGSPPARGVRRMSGNGSARVPGMARAGHSMYLATLFVLVRGSADADVDRPFPSSEEIATRVRPPLESTRPSLEA
jgi:hypothetical protein